MKNCECGCDQVVRNRFVPGHNMRGLIKGTRGRHGPIGRLIAEARVLEILSGRGASAYQVRDDFNSLKFSGRAPSAWFGGSGLSIQEVALILGRLKRRGMVKREPNGGVPVWKLRAVA